MNSSIPPILECSAVRHKALKIFKVLRKRAKLLCALRALYCRTLSHSELCNENDIMTTQFSNMAQPSYVDQDKNTGTKVLHSNKFLKAVYRLQKPDYNIALRRIIAGNKGLLTISEYRCNRIMTPPAPIGVILDWVWWFFDSNLWRLDNLVALLFMR